MSPTKLPSSEHPPVSETVLGVQFMPLAHFTNAHLGLLWKSLGDVWAAASVRDAPPLQQASEQFADGVRWGDLAVQFSTTPAGRIQIVDRSRGRMVQVQNSRLHYNWMGSGENYPRYATIRPEFETVYRRFEGFLTDHALGPMGPDHWEITYVNHIPKGTVWSERREWRELFVGLPGPFLGEGPLSFESFGGHWHYEISPRRGRLHVEIQHGNTHHGEEALVMTLTARGALPDAERNLEGVRSGLDIGHETIARGFKALTSPAAHVYWGVIA